MKLKFRKGTKLYSTQMIGYDCDDILVPSGKVLEEPFECDMPENDYHITVAGPMKTGVTSETRIHYKDKLYLKVGDAYNYKLQQYAKNPAIRYAIIAAIASCIIGFIIWKRKH